MSSRFRSTGGHPTVIPKLSRWARFALVRLLLVAALGLSLTRCDDARGASLRTVLEGAGVVDTPPGEALDLQLLCDSSEGSVCGEGIASTTLERLARAAFRHPNSELTIRVVGERPADSRRVASITVPREVDRGERAARAAEERFVATVRASVCPALASVLGAHRPRRSPLAEAFDEIALAKHPTRPVELFALTDLREVSEVADLECGRLPTATDFTARLRRRGLLGPGTLAGVRVHLITGDHEAPPRRRGCVVSMGRERALQSLWRTAFTAAGAETVTFHTDAPSTEALATLLSVGTTRTPTRAR